ncbi:MAG: hypothetical protein KQI35_18115 [Bacteroidetes bacterium]|nr:hypothetical protein [Bacteroidota bacterium]
MKTYLKGIAAVSVISLLLIFESQGQLEPPQLSKDKNFNRPVGVYNASSAGNASNASAGLNTTSEDLGEECQMYLQRDWEPGTIKIRGGAMYEEVPMRYNIYYQQIEFVLEGDTAAIGDPTTIDAIQIDDRTFVFDTFICHDVVKSGYLEVLSEGRLRLLVYRCIRYVSKERKQGPALEADKTYHLEKTYLYAYPGENAIKLPEKRKEILELFSENAPAIKSYLKESNNKLKIESELVDAFAYYNNGF